GIARSIEALSHQELIFMRHQKRFVVSAAILLACLPLFMGLGCPAGGGGGGLDTGSCCAADGSCTVTAQADCSGTWTSGGTCSPNPCTPGAPTVTPQLFVANFTGNGVVSFLNPSTLNGNVAPSTLVFGPETSLVNPVDIVVTAGGILLAANFGAVPPSITVYPGATTANGNVVPARNVQGTNTGLNAPVTLAVNAASDLLFVANNAGTFDINVYSGASTNGFLGNLPPARTIKSAALHNPLGINFGAATAANPAAGDDLYVANVGDNKILVFANASSRNGTIAPDRVLTSAAFTGIFDCFVDSGDRLYVVNGSGGGATKNRIFVINDASTKNGAVTVDSTLTVTGAVALGAVSVDKSNTGYIVEGGAPGAIYVYDSINTRNGAFSPDREITGPNTQLAGPIRVFLLE
ncbi:MAG TPA: hypothetical protein VMV81_01735, partial [Phycisphaerae bacterium]|nr:hypothetical protein [Phycisphaerae bacterium]